MRSLLTQFVLILSYATAAPSLAGAPPSEDDLRLDRYTLKKQSARPEQIDLLSAVIETRFPRHVATTGDAIEYMLMRSGYRFIHTEESTAAMSLELPEVHRSLGPLPLRAGISTIAGPTWQLQESAEHRAVWLERASADTDTSSPPPQPAADSSSRDAGSKDAASAPPEFLHSPGAAESGTWLLDSELTLRANLEAWADQAGWSMQWDALYDYAIDFPASISGTFRQAVESTLEHYRSAPVPLVAGFYSQNEVLLIQAASQVR